MPHRFILFTFAVISTLFTYQFGFYFVSPSLFSSFVISHDCPAPRSDLKGLNVMGTVLEIMLSVDFEMVLYCPKLNNKRN